ncbi:hypothetical protein OEZ86_010013 [Tetradesmus obliquus]|uniref:Uncharacterized protein n=1 Tax=Tetradesmus obliquus TaxID=3088 RepID=A0ABY8UP44_TETOB|nr:hypothetical protein OEZ85_001447 [Tetradesmus obliquus]WIA43564.1 hypothetical protein OEZ86_010013 [Tetradesmus obliquus]
MTGWSMGEEDWGGKPPLWVASSESSYADTTVNGDCVPPRNVGRDRQQTITTSWTETQAFKAGAEFSFTFSQSLGVKDIAHTSATQGMKLSFDWTGTVSTSSATSKTDLYKGSTTMGERCAKDNDWMAMGRMIFGKEFTCEGVATVYVSPILCGGFGFVLKSDDGSGAEGSGAEGWIPVTDRTYLWPLWNRDGEPEKSIAWSKADALNTDTGTSQPTRASTRETSRGVSGYYGRQGCTVRCGCDEVEPEGVQQHVVGLAMGRPLGCLHC